MSHRFVEVSYEPPLYGKNAELAFREKAIAWVASRLIEPGDIVAINAGTTTTETAKNLLDHHLPLAQVFLAADCDEIMVVMPGAFIAAKHNHWSALNVWMP